MWQYCYKSVTWPADHNGQVGHSQEAGHAGQNVWNIATDARDCLQFGKYMKNP